MTVEELDCENSLHVKYLCSYYIVLNFIGMCA